MTEKIVFTFKKPYRFLCIENCGMCCLQRGGLFITKNDFEILKFEQVSKFEKQPEEAPGFYSKLQFSKGTCPFLMTNKCSIYEKRPVICRIFPFMLAYGPNGKLFVSLARCPGVQFSKGRVIDENMVNELLADIREKNNDFFERKKQVEMNTITQEYFELQCSFREVIGKLFGDEHLKGQNIAEKGETIALAFLDIAKDRKWWKEAEGAKTSSTLEDFENKMRNNMVLFRGIVTKRRRKRVKKALEKRKVNYSFDNQEKIMGIDESIVFYDLFGRTFKVKLRDLLIEKPTNSRAEELFQDHIQELLQRFGGGAPMNISLSEVCVGIQRYCDDLNSYSRSYALTKSEIDEAAALSTIINLDTKTAFTDDCNYIHALMKET
ncbi:YkgJ family cysteine cluster protein [Candidatus Bathyarchaeota archaeon]|nr:YkgJ family cysteine cluster protein [Candidatus Bathyarchaeota archaeon]